MGFCVACGRFGAHHEKCPQNPNKNLASSSGPQPPALPPKPGSQQSQADPIPIGSSTWSSDLFDCGSDGSGCCSAYCCFYCFVSENSRLLDGEPHTCCANCCYPGSSKKNRVQALATFGIRESSVDSCLILCCCPCCSEMQVRRELQIRRGQPSRIIPMNERRNIPSAVVMQDDL